MTADLFTLGLEVRSDGVVIASDRLNNLAAAGKTAEDGTSKLSAAFDKLGYSLSNLQDLMMKAASAFALMKLAEVAKEATLLAARYETLGVVMTVIGKNAGYTQSQMTGFQAALQKTGISAVEALQGLALMGQAQIDFANSAKLARIAQDAAVIGNINSSEAFNRMLTGLATGQSIMLHHLGLMTNFEQAYINAAHAAGRTTKDLSETEKAQIRVNEVVRAGVGIAGAYEAAMGTVGKQISSLPRYINDLMVKLGEMGQGALFTAVSSLTEALKYVSKNFDDIAAAGGVLAGVLSGILAAAILGRVVTALQAMYTASVAASVAMTGYGLAATTAAAGVEAISTATVIANRVLSFMGGPIGILIGLVTALAGAWMMYVNAKSQALDKQMSGNGDEADKVAKENAEIREQLRLMKLTKEGKAEAEQTSRQQRLSDLEKEKAQLQANISGGYDGGDIYGDKASADQSRLEAVQKLIQTLPSLWKENQRLKDQQADMKPKGAVPPTTPEKKPDA